MRPRVVYSRFLFGAAAVAVLFVGAASAPTRAFAQKPLPADDGRVRGAPTRPVSYLDMAPGSVQTVPLSPRYHTILEFPVNVWRTDFGDRDIGLVEQVGNKVIIKPTAFNGETSFTVMLDDESLTVVPFLVRPDTAASPVYVLRFTDPIAKHVADAETAIAQRLEQAALAQLPQRAEALLRQRAQLGFDMAVFPKSAQASQLNRYGERVTIEVVKVLYMQTLQNSERAYLLYRIGNLTRRPVDSLELTIRVERRDADPKRPALTDVSEIYDAEDSRNGAPIPAGTVAEGVLVFDLPRMSSSDSFRLTAANGTGLNVSVKAAPAMLSRGK